jgi:hypothetical protein
VPFSYATSGLVTLHGQLRRNCCSSCEWAEIHVAIVTFSPQTPMIKEVLKQRFPDIVDKVGRQDT